MFWWATLLYTWPVQEIELMEKCEVVLIFLKPGVFGQLHKIHTPTASGTSTSTPDTLSLTPVITENAGQPVLAVTTDGLAVPVPPGSTEPESITPGSTAAKDVDETPLIPLSVPDNTENKVETPPTQTTTLSNIDIFMTQ